MPGTPVIKPSLPPMEADQFGGFDRPPKPKPVIDPDLAEFILCARTPRYRHEDK